MDEKMEKTTKKTTKAAKSAPAAKDEKMSIEEKKAKLQEKLQELLALAKKKKNSLEYQEISDVLQGHGTGSRMSLRKFLRLP